MTPKHTIQNTVSNNVLQINFKQRFEKNDKNSSTREETLAELFKRHKVVVPSELLFQYR